MTAIILFVVKYQNIGVHFNLKVLPDLLRMFYWFKWWIFGDILCHCWTLAHVDNIINNLSNRSWILDNDFKTLVDVSYPFSRCCNIYIDGDDRGVQVLFNQFRESYPFDYYVRRRQYECQGYFLVSTSAERIIKAMKKVPTKISTTELLIIINNYINESSPLLNVKLFKYSDVNVVAKSGKWSLSGNFLYPREFRSVIKYDDMKHDSGIVNLQGRQLQIATVYIPPHSYLSTTQKKIEKGLKREFFTPKNKREFDGVEVKLFLVIAERLNFTWLIRKPKDRRRYGRPNGTTWSGGMIDQILQNEVDVAFGGIWLKHDVYQYVNLTQPWYQLFIHFLVPRPKPRQSFWALTRPLSPTVWLVLILVIIIQSLNVYTKAWINPDVPSRFKDYPLTLMELTGRLIGIWAPSKIEGLKIQLHLWHIAGLLLVTAYSSSLAARLTTPDYEQRIDTVHQFIENNLTWGREGTMPNFDDYFDLKDPDAGQLPGRFELHNSSDEIHNKILEGNYAIVGTIVESIFFPENDICGEDLANYRVMKDSIGDYYLSFAVQPWLLKSFDKVILWIRETGLAMYHLNNVIHRRTSINLREVLIEHDVEANEATALIMTPLGAGFTMLIIGHLVALVMFYVELRSINQKTVPSGSTPSSRSARSVKSTKSSTIVNEKTEINTNKLGDNFLLKNKKT
ncbi:uncharacterized protein [Chelonus insularis]|uniref:uncharacterized protein n=1 Tax=Chelonus insularis TaxID=460826 RepID=UPI00158DFA73|nr:uncharacterized protein LOC118075135 [Chelonus insularis]